MKRFFSVVCSFLLAISSILAFFPMNALADEEERGAIYVQVPSDWENPCVWAWDEEGNNAFSAWPGGETDVDENNEGWYYIWVPVWANHIIVNANEGEVQTGELILEQGNAWIVVSDADTVEISYDSMTNGEAPEYVEKFEIHAKVDESWETPHLWAWSAPDGTNAFAAWPGQEMKAGEDGWYTAKAPIWVNSLIVNGKDGDVQTEDISIDPSEIWITVNEDGTSDFSYVDPDKEEAPNISVRVSVPADWDTPCLWAWSAPDGTNVFATWPGEAFEEEESGWLVKEIPGWVNSVIVNGNAGDVQTTDISVETGKDIWLVVSGPEEFELSYEEPELPAGAAADSETADDETADDDAQAAPSGEAITDAEETDGGSSAVPIAVGCGAVAAAGIAGAAIAKNKKKK
ncbi:MAG: starch-binding protein [Lachnospiraceae bacterium]|nr:starch-binding protein [Lachnospiraceae bacterium]